MFDVKGLAANCSGDALLDQHIRNQEFANRVLMEEATQRAGRLIDKVSLSHPHKTYFFYKWIIL
jgi:hypothetical protein